MVPQHIAIIPDGNRRWARIHSSSYLDTYLKGERFLAIIDRCLELGVTHISAFGSSDLNVSKRPHRQIMAMHNGVLFVADELAMKHPTIRTSLFGDIEAIPDAFGRPAFRDIQARAAEEYARKMDVHLGVNYSDIPNIQSSAVPPVDLVLRTGGQFRLSGFLPLQSAQAELWFSRILWPDFTLEDFATALAWYAEQIQTHGG